MELLSTQLALGSAVVSRALEELKVLGKAQHRLHRRRVPQCPIGVANQKRQTHLKSAPPDSAPANRCSESVGPSVPDPLDPVPAPPSGWAQKAEIWTKYEK